jgi:hypothetical protein
MMMVDLDIELDETMGQRIGMLSRIPLRLSIFCPFRRHYGGFKRPFSGLYWHFNPNAADNSLVLTPTADVFLG